MDSRHRARSRPAQALLLAFTIVLFVPAVANAAVRCVPLSNTAGCDSSHDTIQHAVNLANNGDTIRIAAGTYVENVTANDILTFVGAGTAGAGNTVIQAPTADNSVGLSATSGGTIRALRVLGGDGTAGNAISFPSAADSTLTIDGVVAIGGEGSGFLSFGGDGVHVTNGSNPAKLFVASSTLTGGGGSIGGDGVYLGATGGTSSLTNSSFHGGSGDLGNGRGIHLTSDGTADVSGSTAADGALVAHGSLTASRSRFLSGLNFAGLDITSVGAGAKSSATLIDSLVSATGGTPTAAAHVSPTDSEVALIARGTTFFADHPAQGGVWVTRASSSDPAASASLQNSIARIEAGGAGAADLTADRSTITADFSSFTTTSAPNGGSAPAPGSASNVTGDPLFTNAAGGDFTLQSTSPLIDRGDASIVTPGELDLAGGPRSLDANLDCLVRPDIGAFERPGGSGCPAQANQPPGIGSFTMDTNVFAPKAKSSKGSVARKRKVKRGTTFRYSLSEAAKVTITIERKLTGRRVKRKGKRVCAKPTRKNRKKRKCTRYKRAGRLIADKQSGRQSTPFSGRFKGKALRRGRYRARIVAVDPQGARSAERRLSFRIVKP